MNLAFFVLYRLYNIDLKILYLSFKIVILG